MHMDIEEDGPLKRLTILQPTDKASWERFAGKQKASACLEVDVHAEAGWAQLVLTEGGSKTSKQTFITLDREGREALRAFLA